MAAGEHWKHSSVIPAEAGISLLLLAEKEGRFQLSLE